MSQIAKNSSSGGGSGSSTSYFLAYNSGQTNLTGDGTVTQVAFNVVAQQNGTGYNAGTGTFTAPVSGVYQCTISVTINNVAVGHTSGLVFINTNDASAGQLFTQYNPATSANAAGEMTMQVHSVIKLTAGETVMGFMQVSGSTKTVGVKANNFNAYYSYFSMSLLA